MKKAARNYQELIENDPNLKRIVDGYIKSKTLRRIEGPEDAAAAAISVVGDSEVECLLVVALNNSNAIVDIEVISIGARTFTCVDPAVVFKWLLTRDQLPTRFYIAHNHPSGESKPSRQDEEVTRRIEQGGKAIGIEMIDHLVVTRSCWTSITHHMKGHL